MPVWLALGATLAWNYLRHRTGKSTLCSSGRTRIGWRAFLFLWGGLTGWLVPHYCRPLWRKP